jgi:hypothetical protein
MKRIILVLALLLASCASAAAQGKEGGVSVGLLVGGHGLTQSETKDVFGDVWPNLTLALFWQDGPQREGLTVDVSGRWGNDDGDATLIPVTIGWWQDLAELWGEDDELEDEEKKSWRSYVAARFGPFYGKVKDQRRGIDESTVGLNGHLVLGALFGRQFLAELRYDWYTEIADVLFEGLTFQIGFLLNP